MPLLGTLFTLPDAPTMLSGIGSTSAPIITDFLPAIYLVGGLFLGIGIVILLIRSFQAGVRH